MKILFDNQIFNEQKYGGVSRYFSQLLKKLHNSKDIYFRLPIKYSRNEYLKEVEDLKIYSGLPASIIKNKFLSRLLNRIAKEINTALVRRELKRQNFNIFHPTYYSTYFLKYLKNKKFVLTIYDMIHEIYPDYFKSDRDRTVNDKKELALKANKIIAISKNTKQDIIDIYGISEEKIKVIYLANSLKPFVGKPIGAPDLPQKYILFVGSRGAYKNFIYFISSIAQLLKDDKELCIIVAGGYSGQDLFSESEKNLFLELAINDQIFQYSVNDEILAYLYKNARCFVFPTLYEGFGIPVLEAFACDCPAVISNTSSLPEVGGSAAVYFNPLNADNMLESVRKVVYNNELRQEMILKGREQLKKFSWEKTAEETASLYLEI
jgi:glycosyltransferase involved in cell wall biosynthesis